MRWWWKVEDEAVVVDADPDVAVSLVLRELGSAVVPATDHASTMAESAPPPGAEFTRGEQRDDAVAPARTVPSLVARGGVLAGRRWELRAAGAVEIGRAGDCDVVLPDPCVSRHHVRLVPVTAGSWWVHPLGPAPVAVDGRPVDGSGALLGPGGLLQVGGTVLGPPEAADDDADLSPGIGGTLEFNRPARLREHRREPRIALPGPPPPPAESVALPWAMAAGPAVVAAASAWFLRAPLMLLTALTSPLMVLAAHVSQRRASARRTRREDRRRELDRRRVETTLEGLDADQRSAAWRRLPDPATVAELCRRRGSRLWERRSEDSDALLVRVGLAVQALDVALVGPGAERAAAPTVGPVPVPVDLREAGVLGIAGPPEVARGLARWVVLQLVALRSPRDLMVVVVCPDDADDAWDWVVWAPHVQSDDPGGPPARVGNTDETRAARVAELAALVEARRARGRDDRDTCVPEVVLLVDGARDLRRLGGLSTVLRDGPAVGVHAVCLDRDRVRLPEEARAQVVVADDGTARLQRDGGASVSDLLVDVVPAAQAGECARALTPVQHIGGAGDARELPVAARLAEILGREPDDDAATAAAWVAGRPVAAGVVGVGSDGPVVVDLVADGPHVLVAGTTGSGKSEFLQTLVTSFALGAAPDALTFVLVDYKGAAAFAECADLPHTVGLVTNLDRRGTERALSSLQAEIERRERVLRDLGARDLDAAWAHSPAEAAGHLPRLVIVVDEFAELSQDLPDFVSGLIRVARVGRSLGIHLVLATQRPTGVITAEMQANLGLRVALRTADPENSREVLGVADAAAISPRTPGRGLLRPSASSAPVAFQTARVAGPVRGSAAGAALRVRRLPWDEFGVPCGPLSRPAAPAGRSELGAWVAGVRKAAERLGVAAGAAPWLPPLPEVVDQSSLEDPEARDGTAGGRVPRLRLGLVDLPEEQAQGTFVLDLAAGGHLALVGGARTGRTGLVRAAIAEVCRYSPDDVHLYLVDGGGGGLGEARTIPHCGAVVHAHEPARVVRLVRRLVEEVERRRAGLVGHGHSDLAEQRACTAGCPRPPYLLVVIDRWEGVLAGLGPDDVIPVRDGLSRLLREGATAGVQVLLTGDRTLLADRMAGLVGDTWVLRLTDREDYRLAGLRPSSVESDPPPGRCLRRDSGTEMQCAVLGGVAAAGAQVSALREALEAAAGRWASSTHTPFRVDALPARIDLTHAASLPDGDNAPSSEEPDGADRRPVLAVGGDDLRAHRVDLLDGDVLVVGPRGSGRSTALASLVAGLGPTVPVLALCPRPSPLRESPRPDLILTGHDEDDPRAAREFLSGRPGAVVVVDDADRLIGTDLENVVQGCSAPVGLVVATLSEGASTHLRGLAAIAAKGRQGLVLWPSSPLEGVLFGTPLPREALGRAGPGRAALLVEGEWRSVQVPVVQGSPA